MSSAPAEEPTKGATRQVDLGGEVALELVFIPPGEFMMDRYRTTYGEESSQFPTASPMRIRHQQ
ncbi:MAG: hypothetical protein ACC661_04825 [Verrucomicrobiales bacterium]